MNFFEHQEQARKKTTILFLYFFLAIVLIIIAIDLLLVGLIIYLKNIPFSFALFTTMLIETALFVSPAIILIIVIGTLFRLFRLKAGGIAVAELANATLLESNPKDFKEQQFVNVVEEMSIASGIPVPKLYVMRKEPAINAFVAGIKPSDTVMVVSQGALTELNRDELQGVVGHEYSHILNSDMQISVKLIGLLAGVLLIGQLGQFILRSMTYGQRKKGNGGFILFLFRLGVFAVGYIGLFFGRLIKAAISRQRELLADSSSVQFTRNPTGLVGALQKIQQSTVGTHLNSSHAEDISHLCFCPSLAVLFTQLLDTHPPLDERIKRIDPNGEYRRTVKNNSVAKENLKKQKTSSFNIVPIPIATIQNSIGNPSDAHVNLAMSLLNEIPNNIKELSHTPSKVEFIYYALISSSETEIPGLYQTLSAMERRAILPLIDISIPAFRENTPEERRRIFNTLEALVHHHPQNLFQFTLLGIIGKNVEDRQPQDQKVKYDNFDDVIPSLSILATFVILAGHHSEEIQKTRLDVFIKKLTAKPFNKPSLTTFDPHILLPALKELNLLSPLCKQQLLQTCLGAIQDDGNISIEEAELIRGIAACLDCPIPPIIATI